MAENRIRIQKDTEKSTVAGSLIRTDANNEQEYFTGANGQLLSVVGGVPTFINSPAGYTFSITDGTTTQIIASGDTVTINDGNGILATVSATDIINIAARLSADAGNDITFGTDGGLYLSKNSLLTNVTWNDATNNLVLTFDSGATVNVPIIDSIATFISDFTISDGTNTDLVQNHETLNFAGASGIRPTVSANTVTYGLRTQKDVFTGLTTGNTNTLTQVPLLIFRKNRNGLDKLEGTGNDFTITGTTVTWTVPFGSSGGGAGTESTEFFYTY
jgi:hypothetical protein